MWSDVTFAFTENTDEMKNKSLLVSNKMARLGLAVSPLLNLKKGMLLCLICRLS